MGKSLRSMEIILDKCDADLDNREYLCIFVLFEFHETTHTVIAIMGFCSLYIAV